MDSFARFHHSLALMTSHALVVLLAISMLSSQHAQAQAPCSCSEIATMMDAPESEMEMSSGSGMLNVVVENLTVAVGDECNNYIGISWMLRGDSVMLSDVNFTITITDSMGIVNRTIDIVANNCISNTMTCGEYLTEFNYANVDELEKNEAYNVSITTSIDETNNVHVLLTPVVSIIANTTIPVPGELNITFALLGPDNRTLVNQIVENSTDGELELITRGFEIITFSNNTVYDLNFTQVNDMDIYENYSIAAELRNEQPAYNNSITTTAGNRLNITDIIPTANYTLCLRARNCGGLGPEECITIIAPEAAPVGSPRNLTADPGMQNVTLMWLAPIQPNGIITYSYYIIDDEDMTVANGTTMDLSVTVTGLTEFTNYTCNVTASTSVGSTDPATEMFTTLQGISGVVDDLMVTPAERSVLLTANPPPVSNGIIVTYIVSYNVNGSTNITTMNFTTDNQQRLNGKLGSLLPFTTYVFSVRACTTVGCSNSSDNVTEMTLEDAPSMPINLLINAINATSVNLTWDEPAMPNGIIRNYTVTVLNDVMDVVQNQTVSNMMSVITQLTPDTFYMFNVTAATVRSGDPASVTLTTPALPTAPLNVTVNTGNMLRTLIVEWEPPDSPAGIIITYMVTYNDTTEDIDSNDTNYTITGLSPYTNYSVTVLACTSNGCGNNSDVTIGTTAEEAPDPPLNVNVTTVNSTAIQISWDQPDITNGIIRYYTVVYRLNDSSQTAKQNSTDTMTVVANLDPFSNYVFYVLAFTVASSDPSDNVTAMTAQAAPGAPINVTARNASSTSILVMWEPPMTRNGIIVSYRVEYTRMTDNFVGNANTTNTSVIIGMLEKFTTYQVQVFAITVAEGNGSVIVEVTTDEDTPGIPGDFFVNERNSTAIVVSWVRPSVTNGIIIMYEVSYSLGNHSVLDDNATLVPVTATASTSYKITIPELDAFTIYTVAVRALTRIGPGNLTETLSILTDPSSSSPPQNFRIMVLNSTAVELSWNYPESPNGEIRGYLIYDGEFPANEQFSYNITLDIIDDASNQTFVVPNLRPFTLYSFRVSAFSFGDQNERPSFVHYGIATEEVIVRTAEDVPEAPTNFEATANASTMVKLSWGPPNITNGILLYYTIEYYNDTDTLTKVYDNDTFDDIITGLNEDTLYSFVIYANTSVGKGDNATDTAVTFEDRPSAPPQNVVTTVVNSTAILIFWNPPPFLDQNGDITGYQLMITNQNRTNSSAIVYNITNITSYTAIMLEEFEVYNIELAAGTFVGLGPFSDPVSNQTFEDVPSMEPQNVSIFAVESQSFMLSWDPPLIGEQNGILICYHVIVIETQIHYTDDGEEIEELEMYLNSTYNISEGRTQLIDMLHPDYNYTVSIAAATEPGIGPFSDPITERTDMDVPTEPPRNVNVTVNSSRCILLTWERPLPENENGLLLIYYVIVIETQIHYTDDGEEIRGMERYLNRTYNISERREQLIDMLHPDYNYTVRIAAATEPGIGPFSDPITERTDMDVPTEAPGNVNVTVNSSRSIMLTWERPSPEEENGLLLIYHVIVIETQIHYTDDGAEIRGMERYLNRTYNVSERREQLIDSLHPDYYYTVRIAAATEPGIGPFSDPITERTDMDVPTEAPRNTNATVATSHSIMLEWDRPSLAEENGLLVRYHVIVIETQIHYTDDGEEIRGMERYLNRTYNISEGRMQLVEMLHPNYNYTIRVAAATEPGIGPFSDPITERTDMDVPAEAPRNVSVMVDSSRSIMLTWERPSPEEENGLLLIYHVIVIETQIHYTDEGAEIRGMERYLNRTYNVSERREQLIDTLHPDYNYTVRIAAATEPGIGPFSDPITERTDMDVPTETPRNVSVAVNSSRSIMLTWERPSEEEENGLLLIYHVIVIETPIHYTDDGEEIRGMERYLNRTYNVSVGREQLIDILHPDYNYTVRVAAATEPGIGPFSDPITERTDMDAPTEAPRNVSVTVNSSRSIMLEWKRPSPEEENGLLLIYHVIVIETQIHYTDDGEEIRGMERYLNRTYNVSERREELIDMLHPDYNYTVRIAAATEPGIGPFSDPITERTDMDVPTEAPRNVDVTVNSSRSIMLTWERPSVEEENGLILIYHVIVIETPIHYTDDGKEIRGMERYLNRTYNVSVGRVQLIDILHPDYNYTVRIAAATEPGIGPFSDPITERTDMDVPTQAPRNVSLIVDSSHSIMLTWKRPLPEEENGLLLIYHVIVIETPIHYTDDGEEIRGMERYLNRTYNVSERRDQLIDMLHPDYNYTVRIAAATEPGIGPFSDPITERTDMDAPTEVPRNVNVTVNSSRSIILTWERPSSEEENGLLLIYHVIVIETPIHYTDDGEEIRGMEKYLNRTYNVSERREELIDSLHPDYYYTVRIAAATEPGIGPFSDPITARTDMDAPTEAPRDVNVTVNSSRSIMLTWERPSVEEENGLLLIYHVIVIETPIHYTDDGEEIRGMERYLNRTYNVSEGRVQLIDSLHPDYNYTVRIAAATESGIGPFSDPITERTKMDVPTEAPRNVSVTVNSSRSIMLEWKRPSPEEENGLLLIYHVIVIETQIHYTDDGAEIRGMERYLNRTYNVSERREQLIDMLHPDYNYTVRIAAATEPGIGPFSDPITERTDMDAPTEAPRNVNVTVNSSRSIMLTWERPSVEEENGLLLIYHVIVIETPIHYTDDGEEIRGMERYLNRTYNVSERREQLIDSLHPDYNYTVRIAAATESGIGPFSDPITERTKMDVPTEAPRNVSVTVNSSRSIMLEWKRPSPEEENGLLLIYHVIVIETQIHYTDDGAEIRGMERYLNRTYNVSERREQLIDMLHPDYNYTVRIAAATEPGTGPFSDPITERTDMDIPTEAPRNVSVIVNSSRSIVLTWERPLLEEENGLLLIYHVIVIETQIYRLDNETAIRQNQTFLNETYYVSEERAQLIDMLHPNYDYTVRIAAATEPGIGPFSDPITVRTYMDVPEGFPQNFNVTAINYTTVFISWERPIFTEENGIIVMYTITYNGSREEKQIDDLPDKLVHYGEFKIELDRLPRETYITNMSTLVSNSEYHFEIRAATINGSGPPAVHDLVMIEQGTPPVPPDPRINLSPNIPLPTDYPSDPIGHSTLTFVLPLPPEDDGELTDVFIIIQEVLKDESSGAKLRSIDTWYIAFTTPYDPPLSIPPAYIAIEISRSDIETHRFKRGIDGYIINRFVRQTSSGNLVIRLGNESCDPINKTICNGQLKPNTNYSVAYNACTTGGCAMSPLSAPLLTDEAPDDEPTNIGLIIGIVAGVVGFIIVVIIIAVIICCRRRSKHQKYEIGNNIHVRDSTSVSIRQRNIKRGTKSSLLLPASPLKKNGSFFETTELVGPTIVPVKDQPSAYTSDDITMKDNSRRIYLRDLPAHVADMASDSGYKFSEEYERVSEVGLDQPKEASLMAENRAKNRYTNILAYDHSRTKLSFVDDEPGSDYINANYIPGYKMKRAYIATQGPLPCTFDDFWRLIWEQNVYTIVMLTQLVERGRNKCHHYWPGMDSTRHGDVTIIMQSEKEGENWTVREFILTQEKKERVVTQFQFTGWPDHGVPDNPGPVIDFVRTIRGQEDPESNRGPMLVHCSAGVGRTGTFIALDTLLQHVNDHDWIDIYSVACEMRQHRNHMVQTEAQYIFIHKALQEVVESRSTFRYSVYRKSYAESDDNRELSPIMASTKM